jgi:hypothetical protein
VCALTHAANADHSHTHTHARARAQGVTSYVIVRPLCTALALITSQFGAYDEGSLSPNKAYPYLAMATNLSQMWALYCLVMFYHAFKDELHPIRPLSKFICIKAVVFLTFWQGLSLNVLVAVGLIRVRAWRAACVWDAVCGCVGVCGCGARSQAQASAACLLLQQLPQTAPTPACAACFVCALHRPPPPPPPPRACQVNEQFTTYTATDVAEGLQNFLICIEMFLAALAHTYAFPPRVRGLVAGVAGRTDSAGCCSMSRSWLRPHCPVTRACMASQPTSLPACVLAFAWLLPHRRTTWTPTFPPRASSPTCATCLTCATWS